MLLSFVDKFSDSYVPLHERGVLSKPLPLMQEVYADLLNECEQVYQNMAITDEQVKMVEEKTRNPAQNCGFSRGLVVLLPQVCCIQGFLISLLNLYLFQSVTQN